MTANEDELQRLEALFDEPELDQALGLDEAQGYLCAALSVPQLIPEDQWLAEILGSSQFGIEVLPPITALRRIRR